MPPDDADELLDDPRLFWRNLGWVSAIHFLGIGVFCLIANLSSKPPRDQVMWLEGGALASESSIVPESVGAIPEATIPEPEPTEPDVLPLPPEPEPTPEPVASEIVLTPKATPVPATPKPTTPKPTTPKPSTPKPATPKPTTPKPAKPKTTPKSSPKPTGTPKATPKAVAVPKPNSTPNAATQKPGIKSDPSESATGATGNDGPKSAGDGTNSGTGKGAGKAGNGAATGSDWYHGMLQERFEGQWIQPTSIVRSTLDFVTTLKLRISKDGTILSREIVNSSGNTLMDESVMAGAQRVLAVDPLPAGLGAGGFYDVNINFKLDQGQ